MKKISRCVSAALLAILALAPSAVAQVRDSKPNTVPAKQAQAKEPALKTAADVAAKPSSGMGEGIQVHGEWTIVVRNEDRSIAARYEFHNALVNFGVLPTLLSRQGSAGAWGVTLDGPTFSEQPCARGGGPVSAPQSCILLEAVDGFSIIGSVAGLTVSLDNNSLLLAGSVRAQAASHIASVATVLSLCSSSQSPSVTCTTSDHLQTFTRKDVNSMNIQVSANQTIDVTVRISFSNPPGA